ncbi:MAG: glycosyltransferase [Deltaproteobacteria bacterium]|jgi:glycosyltransferase involved in cell wall biosynthesis|nr:glycosyltransferase [Deltaproteobacteria bacterium]
MTKPPVFSIIMATHNAEKHVRGALVSVLGQSFSRYELLIQDKLSTDQTLACIEAHASDTIHLASAPDSGVYDAWNRALERARGEWLLFLGADDRLFSPHVLARSARHLRGCGPGILFAQGALALGRHGKNLECLNRSKCEIFRHFISGMPLLVPAAFFRRRLFAARSFDASYAVAGDFAFTAQVLAPENLALLPFVVAYMEAGGLSSSPRHRLRLMEERRRILEEIVKPRAGELVDFCIRTMEDQGAPLEDAAPLATEFSAAGVSLFT